MSGRATRRSRPTATPATTGSGTATRARSPRPPARSTANYVNVHMFAKVVDRPGDARGGREGGREARRSATTSPDHRGPAPARRRAPQAGENMSVTIDTPAWTARRAPIRLARPAVRLQALPRLHLPAAGGRAAAGVPHLSARPRHLARLHRHADRPRAAVSSGSTISTRSLQDRVFWSTVFNTIFYTAVATVGKFALGLWLALLLNQHMPFKSIVRADHPAAVDRADRAVGDRLLVDLRSAVLDHLLPAGRRAALAHALHRLPRHALARALVADRREYLARHSVRRDHPARRVADDLALALRGGAARRRLAAGSASASSRCRC